MTRSYTMRGVKGSADRAVRLAETYLMALHPQCRIHDVQEDPRFQHRGVDLLLELADGTVKGVEVKGDRQAHRGNYFFELVSNLEKDTPGCFLYSAADLMLYVFLEPREVHHLPMPATRQWFLERAKDFELKHTTTRMGNVRYTTVGAIVPIKKLLAGLEGVARYQVSDEGVTRVETRRAALKAGGAKTSEA